MPFGLILKNWDLESKDTAVILQHEHKSTLCQPKTSKKTVYMNAESNILLTWDKISQSQETTKVLRAAWWIIISLWQASVPSDLWEPIQYCMHCFTLVCVMYHKDCPKHLITFELDCFLDSPVEAFDFKLLSCDSSKKLEISSHTGHSYFNQCNDGWTSCIKARDKTVFGCYHTIRNLKSKQIFNTCCTYLTASTFIYICYIHRMYCNVLSLQTENYIRISW